MSRLYSVSLCMALLLSAAAAVARPPLPLQPRILPSPAAPGPTVLPYIKLPPGGPIALTHVRVIDGTGQPVQEERTIVIADGRITAVSPATAPLPPGARVL